MGHYNQGKLKYMNDKPFAELSDFDGNITPEEIKALTSIFDDKVLPINKDDDYCFDCQAAPILNPACTKSHIMTSFPEDEIPENYHGPPLCDECRKSGLSNNSEYFHCNECNYDLCLCCAFKNVQPSSE